MRVFDSNILIYHFNTEELWRQRDADAIKRVDRFVEKRYYLQIKIKILPKGNSLSGFSEELVVEEFQAGEALIGRRLKEWA